MNQRAPVSKGHITTRINYVEKLNVMPNNARMPSTIKDNMAIGKITANLLFIF